MQAGSDVRNDGTNVAQLVEQGRFPVEDARGCESRLMMKELALMSLERMLVSKAGVLRRREQAVARDEESLRQRRMKFCEARAVLDVQRAVFERELRIFDRCELLRKAEEEGANSEGNPDCGTHSAGTRKRRLWEVMNDAFQGDEFDDLPPAKERRVASGSGAPVEDGVQQGGGDAEESGAGNAEESGTGNVQLLLDWDSPSGVERNAVRDDPGKVTLSKPFMTEPEYNFLLDLLNAFRKCPDVTISGEIYQRIMPEACLSRQHLKTEFLEVVNNWNAIPKEERASTSADLYPVTFIGNSILKVAFEDAVTIPEDFVQVVEVVLNIAMLVCWRGDRRLLEKTTKAMSAISTALSAMVWKGHLDHHDHLVQLNIFIAKTVEQVATHKNCKGEKSLPEDICSLFVSVPHFAASFLHPAILRRQDVAKLLVKYITNSDERGMHVIKGFFWLFQEDLDRIPALNRDIIPISEHVLQILKAPKDEAFRVKCLRLLLYGDETLGNAGILDGLCNMRSGMHRWNLLFIAKRISRRLEKITGEQFKWDEALLWLKWVIRSTGKLPDGWKGEITEWLKSMLPEVRGVE